MASLKTSPLVLSLLALFLFTTQVFAAAAVLGIDLGTEYIKAALVKPGIPLEIVLTKDSRRKETSAVAFKASSSKVQHGQFPERLYGADAMALAARFPGEVYPNLKTLLGLSTDDAIVKEYAARHPGLQLQTHPERDTAMFKTNTLTADEEAWMLEEMLAMELQSVQKNAEITAGDATTVRSVVLTVPPFYTTEEKRALQTAAELAGLKVLSLVSDGLAVGLNYATSRQFPNINEGSKPEYHLVFDMGAGSTKATVMKFQSRTVKDIGKFNKTVQEVQVLGSGWERAFGGDALNYLIVDDMVAQFIQSKAAQKISATEDGVRKHGRAMAKLLKEAERIRHVLSANQNTQASFEGFYEDVDFKYKLTRADFEAMADEYSTLPGTVIETAIKMSGLSMDDLTSVILHGGATRTPFVQKALEVAVGKADKIRSNVNSDEAAVFGAGFRGAELSPSFRVKEIRISEGALYPSGLTWTGSKGKEQRQRLFTATSPMGGPAKEMTFNEHSDFSGVFWQAKGDVDVPVRTFTTKNLTATVAEMKKQYPDCAEADLVFKMGVKLNGENGEVQVSRAFVECEAEVTVKEGIIGGVKNLLGFGKKDQKPLEDGEQAAEEGSEEAMKKEADASAEAAAEAQAAASESPVNAAEKAEEAVEEIMETKKKQLVSIPVQVELSSAGRPELSKTALTKSKDRLKAFTTSDKARVAREEALNQLEGYTYRVRDLLEGETFIEKSSESERTKLAEFAGAASEWLYEEGADATKDLLKAKLKELQDLVDPVNKRIEEALQRPEMLSTLKESLNQTTNFVANMRAQIAEYDAWKASSSASDTKEAATSSEKAAGDFDGLEDEEADSKSDKSKEKADSGPVAPIYKLEDLVDLETLAESTAEWLKQSEAAQEVLAHSVDPVLLVKDLKEKRDKLDKAGMDLAMKAARAFEKPSKSSSGGKKKDKSSAKKDKTATASADQEQATVKLPEFDGEKLTQVDLEQLIKEAQAQAAEDKKDKKKKSDHDEL